MTTPGRRAGSDTERAIAGFVESGKGLVITHGALSAAKGARRMSRSHSAGALHTPVQFFEVRVAQPEHPIVQGMKSGFRMADATYRGLTSRPGAEVIATAVAEAGGGGGKEEPVLIASRRGKGRVLCVALGHDPAAMHQQRIHRHLRPGERMGRHRRGHAAGRSRPVSARAPARSGDW